MLEKAIEAAVCKYAREKGFLAYKFSSPGHLGVPDRIFFGPGRVVFLIEFKSEKGRLTPSQERECDRLDGMGQTVYVVRTVGQGKDVIDCECKKVELHQSVMGFLRCMGEPDHATKH